jgi:hypothetical protein
MSGTQFGTFDVARGKAIASVAIGGESTRPRPLQNTARR